VLASAPVPEELRSLASESGTSTTGSGGASSGEGSGAALEARAVVALMLADPCAASRVVHGYVGPGLEGSEQQGRAVRALFAAAASSLHKPLLLHRGATLEANLKAAAKVTARLRVLDTQDIGHAVFQRGLALKVRRRRARSSGSGD
jgi:hypothetical protein